MGGGGVGGAPPGRAVGTAHPGGGGGGGGGGGSTPMVQCLGLHDPDGSGPAPALLVAAGRFTNAGGVPVSNIAAWNGTQWSALGTPPAWPGGATGIASYDIDGAGPLAPRLIVSAVGMEFEFGDSRALAVWNGSAWVLSPAGPGAGVAVEVFDPDGAGPALEKVYVGLPDEPGIAAFDGVSWSAVGSGLSRSMPHLCTALRVADEDGTGPGRPMLLAGGNFLTAGGSPAPSIARWDGEDWSALGSGPGMDVSDILVVQNPGQPQKPFVYAAGADRVSRWDPVLGTWTHMGSLNTLWPFPPHPRLATYQGTRPSESIYLSGAELTSGPVGYGLLRLSCDGQTCYANCDHSTVAPYLSPNDFICFFTAFNNGESYANCDGVGGLTANDFQCFLGVYLTGCS
jgi:hypothetical protein